MKSPRSVRISRFLGDLTRRAQLVVDELLGAVDSLCARLGFPRFMAVHATVALTRISRVLSYTVLSYNLSDLTDAYLCALERDLKADEGFALTLNFLLQDFVALVAKWEEPAISALLLTLIFNLLLHEDVDPSEAVTVILSSILVSQGRGDKLGEYVKWYCETIAVGSEEILVYVVLEAALAQDIERSPAAQSPLFF